MYHIILQFTFSYVNLCCWQTVSSDEVIEKPAIPEAALVENVSTPSPAAASSTSSTEQENVDAPSSAAASSAPTTEQDKFEQELAQWTQSTPEDELMASSLPADGVGDKRALIPYNLQTQHSLPDKSIADCVEALIGCYLVTCGQRAALQFMAWLGLKV